MIRSFRSKALRRYVEQEDRSKLSVANVARLDRILTRLDAAIRPEQMDQAGWRFHPLKGSMKGRYAVDATANWRLTFGWDGEDAIEVDLEDYH